MVSQYRREIAGKGNMEEVLLQTARGWTVAEKEVSNRVHYMVIEDLQRVIESYDPCGAVFPSHTGLQNYQSSHSPVLQCSP